MFDRFKLKLVKLSLLPLYLMLTLSLCLSCFKDNNKEELINIFPLENYSQNIEDWINPQAPEYDNLLIDSPTQQAHFERFLTHYFGDYSPWNENHVNQYLLQPSPQDLKTDEQNTIQHYNNVGKPADQIGYSENFRPHTDDWIKEIALNINLDQFDNLIYHPDNRGISIDNLYARALPTNDVHFYNYKLAGQGFPFDNLEMSALWVATPLYILAETRDKAWSLVLTPDYTAWVESKGIRRMSSDLIDNWVATAKDHLVAVTHTSTNLKDKRGNFLLSAYIGSVFPVKKESDGTYLMMVPVAGANYTTVIEYAQVPNDSVVRMPINLTRRNLAKVISTLQRRPYGWGNTYLYNDCSAELKSLFTPFGIWLPRHSSDQVKAGKMVDMTSASQEQRLEYLMKNGHPFVTLVYIGGHVVLYIGNFKEKNKDIAMTYQNLWGLHPNPPVSRSVIGQAVFFPMLLQYPENLNLSSLANREFFQVSLLDEISPRFTPEEVKQLKSLRRRLDR